MITFNLSLISKYRTPLMGIATICILLTHAPAYDIILPFHMNAVLTAAAIGVMVFFFVSGIGLYYSLDSLHFSNNNIIDWYKKRFIRLFIPYLIIYVPYYILLSYDKNLGVGTFLFDISTLSFWFGHRTCWFINMLVPLYILSPLWYKILKKIRFPIIPTIIIVSLCLQQNGYWIQASTFFIGFWAAKYIKGEYSLQIYHILYLLIFTLISLFLYYKYDIGYLLLDLLIPFIMINCTILNKIRAPFIHKILVFFGKISLESYLFNVTLYYWITYFELLPDKMFRFRYLFIVIFGIFFSYIVNAVSNPLMNRNKISSKQ